MNQQQSYSCFSFVEMPRNSPAIKVLSLCFGLLVFLFSPDTVHAEFLDRLKLMPEPLLQIRIATHFFST